MIPSKSRLPALTPVCALMTSAYTTAFTGACPSPSGASTWLQVTSGTVTVTLLVDRAVIGIFAALTSATPMQAVGPSRPLDVTVVCAHTGPAISKAISAAVTAANLERGGGYYLEFHFYLAFSTVR